MQKKAVVAILVLAAGFALSACKNSGNAPASKAATEKTAPDFTLKDLSGKDFTLSKETKGKAVILNFWATWCPPCRMEIPSFIKLYEKYKSKGLVIVGVALDEGGAGDVAPFVKSHSINYPVVLGAQPVADAYGGIVGIPTTFFIDTHGAVAQKLVGAQSEAFFEKEIDTLLDIKGN